jgi:glycosyltransferase involved in cell wall biosynthesis
VWREQGRLPGALRDLRIDVVHSIGNVGVLRASCANVVTIHDLHYLHFPESFSFLQLMYRRLLVPPTIRSAQLVAVSDYTRDDIIARFGTPPERVTTVLEGVDPRYQRLDPDAARAAAMHLTVARSIVAPYVFYPGALLPHKNHKTLVHALALAAARGVTLELIISGPSHDGQRLIELRALAAAHRVQLRHLGYVSSEELVTLYNNATVHVLPSLFEGFGLTLLEAMACGCPVIASRRGSIPEIVGDAAILADPDRPDQFADGICQIVGDVAVRERLIAAGLKRAHTFTWRRCAEQLVNVYERSTRT